MQARSLMDLGLALTPQSSVATPRRVADGNVAVAELEALRLDADLIAPPESAALSEPLVESFRATPTSGDHLRLPPPGNHSGAQIRRSLQRFMAVRPEAAPFEAAVIKEAQLRKILTALQGAHDHIQRQQKAAG